MSTTATATTRTRARIKSTAPNYRHCRRRVNMFRDNPFVTSPSLESASTSLSMNLSPLSRSHSRACTDSRFDWTEHNRVHSHMWVSARARICSVQRNIRHVSRTAINHQPIPLYFLQFSRASFSFSLLSPSPSPLRATICFSTISGSLLVSTFYSESFGRTETTRAFTDNRSCHARVKHRTHAQTYRMAESRAYSRWSTMYLASASTHRLRRGALTRTDALAHARLFHTLLTRVAAAQRLVRHARPSILLYIYDSVRESL